MQTPESTSLIRGWTFRILLLLAALACFLSTFANTADRLSFSMDGVPATIERISAIQKAPTDWSSYEGHPRSVFAVRAKAADGKEAVISLYLTKDVINALLDGKQAQIIFIKDNPQRYLMKGEPLPPFGLGWLLAGGVFFGLFLYSLKLR